MVFATRETTRGLVVNIAPISTRQYDPKQMIALPAVVTAHLGLDSRSVIVTSEYNAFIWIGPDVFPRDNGDVFYGAMPARLFEHARDQLIANRRNLVVRTQ